MTPINETDEATMLNKTPGLTVALLVIASTTNNAFGSDQDNMGAAPTPNMFTAVVEPGKGGNCLLTPCRVYYRMPDLNAPAKVVVNNLPAGTFEPGKYADLGSFNDPTLRITVPGADVPTAYVNISDSGNF